MCPKYNLVYACMYTCGKGVICGQGLEVRVAVNSFGLTAASRRAPAREFLCQAG